MSRRDALDSDCTIHQPRRQENKRSGLAVLATPRREESGEPSTVRRSVSLSPSWLRSDFAVWPRGAGVSKATQPDAPPRSPTETLRAIHDHFWSVFLRGVAIVLPVVVTIYIVSLAVSYIAKAFAPFIDLLEYFGLISEVQRVELVSFLIQINVYEYVVDFLAELIALAILLAIVLVVGSVGHNRYGGRVIDGLDLAIASIPGLGTVYKSFRRMGDVMLTSDHENFQDVKLVQCLDEDMYVIGFQTNAAPEPVEAATGHEEMMTIFVPMAPNPVTGGFLTYVPTDRVYDVDMTIEDGVKSILTSGVATGADATSSTQFTLGNVRNVAQVDRIQDAFAGQSVEEPGSGESEDATDPDDVDEIE